MSEEEKLLPKPDEPELPAPEEKLLRAPRFFEKYPWVKWVLIGIYLIAAYALIYYFFIARK